MPEIKFPIGSVIITDNYKKGIFLIVEFRNLSDSLKVIGQPYVCYVVINVTDRLTYFIKQETAEKLYKLAPWEFQTLYGK